MGQATSQLSHQKSAPIKLFKLLPTEIPLPEHCVACHNFNPFGHSDSKPSDEGHSLARFFHVSDLQAGCAYCELISRLRHEFAPPEEIRLSVEDMVSLYMIDSKPTAIEFRRVRPGEKKFISEMATVAALRVYVEEKCDVLPYLGVLGTVSPRSDSDECYDFIQTKLRNCTSSYPTCSLSPSRKYPKRVLKINNERDYPAQLISQTEFEKTASYAALSHCWGSHQPLRTIKANIDNMMRGINRNQLPTLFQDAIRVCQRLKIGYLWIDSLCIIQDSSDDWEIESGKMSDYYENALITIVAATSSDSTEQFLMERDRRWLPRYFELSIPGKPTCTLTAREHVREERVEDNEKLSSRAWAWQEAVLSSRAIVYSHSNVTWICKSESIAEDGSTGRRQDTSHVATGLPDESPTSRVNEVVISGSGVCGEQVTDLVRNETLHEKQVLWSWFNLVESFSSRSLTYETDRLPALSGVAFRVQEKFSCGYLAGLWENHLVLSLCWQRENSKRPFDQRPYFVPKEYIAPSWSWASVGGAINHFIIPSVDKFTPRVQMLQAQCEASKLNPLGKVTGGHLLLKGLAVLVPIYCKDPQDWWQYRLGSRWG